MELSVNKHIAGLKNLDKRKPTFRGIRLKHIILECIFTNVKMAMLCTGDFFGG